MLLALQPVRDAQQPWGLPHLRGQSSVTGNRRKPQLEGLALRLYASRPARSKKQIQASIENASLNYKGWR